VLILKKRSICLILIIFFIVLLIPPNVFATGNVSIVSNENNAINGEEFEISVDLSGVPSCAFQIEMSFDESKLDYVSGPENSNRVGNTVYYIWLDETGGQNPIKDGTVVQFKFKAKATGTAAFGINGLFYDKNGNAINPTFVGTSVNIINTSDVSRRK